MITQPAASRTISDMRSATRPTSRGEPLRQPGSQIHDWRIWRSGHARLRSDICRLLLILSLMYSYILLYVPID